MAEHADLPEELPTFQNVRSRLQRHRAKEFPPIPNQMEDVHVHGVWEQTWAGRQFLSLEDINWGILVFCTLNFFRILGRCETVYIDGTFKTGPRPFYQFVTIHGKYVGSVLTLAMCLASGKTVAIYRQILQHLKRKIRLFTGQRWRPHRIVCDFEPALILAI